MLSNYFMNKVPLVSTLLGLSLGFSANAMAMNIGGISISPGDNFEVASIYENEMTAVGDELRGYGEIAQIQGDANFCATGPGTCELTYAFGGFIVTDFSATNIIFDGGWVRFYVGSGAENNFNPFTSSGYTEDLAAATDGSLWLTLVGHNNEVNGSLGTLFASGTGFGAGNAVGEAAGLFDVDIAGGGSANAYFDTNMMLDNMGGVADFTFTSSFGGAVPPHSAIGVAGSADIRGVVAAVPEPTSIALIGLGLLGLITIGRKQK